MRGNVLILEDNKLQMGKLRDLLEGLPYELKVFLRLRSQIGRTAAR